MVNTFWMLSYGKSKDLANPAHRTAAVDEFRRHERLIVDNCGSEALNQGSGQALDVVNCVQLFSMGWFTAIIISAALGLAGWQGK